MRDLDQLREELVLACKRAYRRGIQTGSGGNVSARVPGEELMLVKASGKSFEDSTPDGFIVTDFDGKLVEGVGKPTREALLHGYIYRLSPSAGSVMHVHSPYSIGWASTLKALPRVTWHSQLKISSDIQTLNIPSPIVRQEDFPLVKEIFETDPGLSAFLLVDHGVVALGASPIEAEHTAELIEETAQIAFLKALAKRLEM